MKISLKKINEEKFEIKIIDGDSIIFNDIRYYNYMDNDVIDDTIISDAINQLSSLFGEFTEIENDFNV